MSRGDYRESHANDRQATSYDAEFQDPRTPSGVLWELEQPMLHDILQNLAPIERSLDFACGTGRILSIVEQYAEQPEGVDISPNMLALAGQRVKRSRVMEGDITTDERLAAGPYDLITAFRFFLEAGEELRHEALEALRARIKDDGRFVANFHRNPQSVRGLYFRARTRMGQKRLNMLSVSEVHRLLVDHGFAVERQYGYCHSFYRSREQRGARLRRRLDRELAKMPWLADYGMSFLIVARPV